MTLAYRDRVGGPWHIYRQPTRDLFTKRVPVTEQYRELEGLGNVIIATVRGNRIVRRFVRGY